MTQPSFMIFSPDGRFARVLRVAEEDWTVVCWVPPPARGPRYAYDRPELGDRLVVELTGEERDGNPVARLVGHEALDGSWALPCAFSTVTLSRAALGVSWVRCDAWSQSIWAAK